MTPRKLYLFVLLVCLPFLGACQNTLKHRDWSQYDGPGKEYFLAEEFEYTPLNDPLENDPLEPGNRAIWGFNDVLLMYLVRPVAWVYRGVLPEPVRNGVENAFENLLYPVRLTSSLFQGKFNGAWRETERFVVNSTVGILGIRDQATRWDIEASKEDWGQTFGCWGWRNSSYLVFPVLGPSTIRDGVGKAPDALTDPLAYFPPWSVVRSGTRISNVMPTYETFVDTNYDPYTLARRLFILNRELLIDDYVYEGNNEASGEAETLGSVFLGPLDPDFPGERTTHSVQLEGTQGELRYSVWLHDKGKKTGIGYFLPGTGGHRLGGSATGIAEAIYNEGLLTPVTISSAFNFEFIEGGSTEAFPGFAPADARDIHVALTAIDADLRRRYPDRFNDERYLAGISLGGLHTLFIAAREKDPGNVLLDFDGYLAMNAPVDLKHAVSELDRYYNAPLVFPPEERREQVDGILRKVLFLADGKLEPDQPLPISRLEAEFLIGLSFRFTLGDIIYQTTAANPRGVLLTKRSKWKRASAYQEIARYSFMEYFYAWALPYFAEKRMDIDFTDEGAERLFGLCDLRSIEEDLTDNDEILFVTNRNDFLLRPEDFEWVERVFGDEQSLIFERGGHTGNLFMWEIQEAITAKFRESVQNAQP